MSRKSTEKEAGIYARMTRERETGENASSMAGLTRLEQVSELKRQRINRELESQIQSKPIGYHHAASLKKVRSSSTKVR